MSLRFPTHIPKRVAPRFDSAWPLHGAGAGGYGTVFEMTPAGTEKVLINFTGGSDGGYPGAGLSLLGGTSYTTLYDGGKSNAGTVFALRVP